MTDRALGFDVSFYQDNDETPQKIDFQKMRRNGADFVILRAGQNWWIDEDFIDYANDSSKVQGLLRGSYWFYDARNYVQKQCELYWELIDNFAFDLPPVMDFESASVKYISRPLWSRNYFLSLIGGFLNTMDGLSGVQTMFYTNPGWLRYLSPLPDWLKERPFWVAYYGPESYLKPESGLFGMPKWDFWQQTAKGDGAKFGVESKSIDQNVFNGTRAELLKRLKVEPEEPDPEVHDLDWLIKIHEQPELHP